MSRTEDCAGKTEQEAACSSGMSEMALIPCGRKRRGRLLLDGGFMGAWHMVGGRLAGAELDLAGLTAR